MYAAKVNDQQGDMARALFPRPPSLHWALVFLFTILTFGIFGFVWYFIQSSWTKKIDSRSNATLYLILASVCWLICVPLSIYSALANGGQPSLGTSMVVLLVQVAMLVFMYSAFFSMAASLRKEMPKHGVHMSIGGITLFFFTSFYLQGQLSWLARWKDTGQKDPAPPKGIFWALFAGVMALAGIGVVLVIALIGSSLSDFSDLRQNTQTSVVHESANFEPAALPEPEQAQFTPQPTAEEITESHPSGMEASDAENAGIQAADAALLAVDAAAEANDYTSETAVQNARAELEQEQEVVRRERELLAEQRRQLEHEQTQEALRQERNQVAEQRRQLEQQQEQLQQNMGGNGIRRQQSGARELSADEQYENRRNECPAGFLGSECRKRIRATVCEGHWSSSPPNGYQSCKL